MQGHCQVEPFHRHSPPSQVAQQRIQASATDPPASADARSRDNPSGITPKHAGRSDNSTECRWSLDFWSCAAIPATEPCHGRLTRAFVNPRCLKAFGFAQDACTCTCCWNMQDQGFDSFACEFKTSFQLLPPSHEAWEAGMSVLFFGATAIQPAFKGPELGNGHDGMTQKRFRSTLEVRSTSSLSHERIAHSSCMLLQAHEGNL